MPHMDIFSKSERLMGMSDTTWARHSNPWSVYTRFSALPLLCLAIWSRAWIGTWAWGLVAACVLWIWLNPRLFPIPTSTKSWASRVTLGERVYLNRKSIPIPQAHSAWGLGLSIAAGLGLIPMVWGLWIFDLSLILLGLVTSMGAKTWFCDRMVFLYDQMKDADPGYASWLR